jgi:hypothetical protein
MKSASAAYIRCQIYLLVYRLKFWFEKIFVFRNKAVGIINHATGIMLHAEFEAPLHESSQDNGGENVNRVDYLVDLDSIGSAFDTPSRTGVLNALEILDENAVLLALLALVFGFAPVEVSFWSCCMDLRAQLPANVFEHPKNSSSTI